MLKFIAFAYLAVSCFIVLLNAQPRILPTPGGGSCEAGRIYTINSIDDLKANVADLECIFAAGLAPDAIGLGFNYGTVLLGENSFAVQPIAAPFYQGDYVVRTTCQQKTVYFGTLKVAGISVGTAPWTLAPFTEAMAQNEAPINPTINNIVMDFRQNVQDVCPIEDAFASLNSKGFLPFRSPVVPVNCFVDIARVVGRDVSDGGTILLAKGMNNDPIIGWQTSLFYAMKNFDPAVKPSLSIGTSLKVPSSFDYLHNGFVETITRFGGSGLIPMLSNAKRYFVNALSSNPLVAALTLGAGGFSAIDAGSILPFGGDLLLRDLSFLEGFKSSKVSEGVVQPAAQLLQDQGSDATDGKLIQSAKDFWDGLRDEDVEGVLHKRLQEFYDMMTALGSLEDSPMSQQHSGNVVALANNLRRSGWA